ncbi:tail fiber domain-containing protein [Anaerostipes sp. Marseille-Q3525]|uniref:tail fiber domain-containing protein n=1 Tax=Anaerostipes sp. Marseille-Q3525 TaxID=2758418 RepID=UPI001BABC157|nr:tail fiber domain-containing protein [Anaerostipes sp. Marseille-Q3525]MBR9960942.1 tail fiber domain-containing protein [Anaerostipes sp. Marseille-Q3525]
MNKTIAWAEGTFVNVTEPFTVMLTNEAQQFATDSNRKVTSAQSYYTDIIVIRGSQERTDYTIGNITSGSGITVSKSSKRVTFSVSADTTIGADTGVIEIPITLDGQTVKKQFSWSCGKQGPQGVKGEDGSNFAWNLLKGTGTAKEFTPKGNLTNQTTLFNKLDLSGQTLKEGDKFVISCDLEWTQFTQGTSGTFDYWFQGSVDYSWSYDNIFTQGLQKVQPTKAEILASDGKKHLSAVCTMKQSLLDKKIFEIGIRFDNTDGTGKIKISNLKIAKEDKESPWCLHPDELKGATGDKGKSVQSVIEYYLATSASTGVTTSTSGWSTDPTTQKLTAEKKYLWNCKQTVYDDGTRGSITSPVICGTYGDKGDTGQKGQDGTSIKITSKSVTYQTSTSGTTAPTGTWSTTVPTVNNGQYLWTKTTVQYSDGNKTEAYSVSYKGTNGTNGTSVTVSKTEVTYQVSTSGTTAPTGAWSTTMPSCDQGQYLWTKTYVKYSDGKDTTSYSVSYKGVDGEKFSWNALIGSSFLYNSLPNNVNFSMATVNNVSATAFTTNGLHYKATASNGAPNSSRGVKINSSVLDLKVGDTVTFSCDVKGTFGTKNNGLCLMHATTTDNNSWAAVHNGLKYSTSIPDWTRKSKTYIIPSNIKIESDGSFYLYFYFGGGTGSEVDVYVRNIQLEKGSAASPWAPHPKDLEGRGVSQTVQYYLATSQASGVTSSTSGWSTDITTQKLTADKKYLWNCYQTKYSDGTSEPISTPKVIGVYGDKGQNAKNLSITPSSQYFKSTDGGKTFAPNTITIKPTIQGEISFGKWQYSIDGGVSFADVVSGQKGLTINNNMLAVSKDSSLYSDAVTMVTFRAVASDSSFYDTCSIAKIYDVSDIGDGRNLLLNTSSYRESNPLERTGLKTDDWSTYPKIITSIDLSVNQKYTLQAKTDSNWATKHDTGGHTPSEKLVGLWLVSDDTNTFLDMSKGYAVFTVPKTTKYKLRVNQYSDGTNSYTIRLWDIKLEKGQSASGWSAAPEDVQTAILSTKSEISDVSLKVDKNKQAIEQRVEKTTYQQDLNLVKGDISKANEGLNKWRYEIYPKSLFASEYQGKSTMDVFAKNTNLTPSQSVLINDTDFGKSWAYGDNYIGYALTFVKFSAAKSVAITFKHDDGAHLYLNGKLIGGDDTCNTSSGESLTLSFIQGWNCLEVVLNEKSGGEYIGLGTTISALSECQLMNCYYGTPVARQSHITNQLVENMTNINGISTKVSKVMSVIGEDGKNFTDFKNDYSDFKQTMNGFKTTVGQTYVTKDDFNGLEIGGRNLLLYSQTIRAHNNYYGVSYLIDEVETFNGCPVWSVKDQWGKLAWSFKSHVIDRGLVKVGDTLTYSLYAKTNNASGKSISCSYRFKGNAQAYWFKGSAFNIGTSWARYSATFTVTKDMLATDTYMNEIGFEETVSMSGDDKVYFACPKLERGTKATDYTEAPEDDKINGQNLVSNLPSNWEQGTVSESSAVGTTYANTKSSNADTIRPKELIPVHGDITISAAYSNQSKKPIRHWIAAYDINKNYLGQDYVLCAWNDFPQTLNMKDAKYIAIMVGYTDGSPIAPSDISQICLKIERGTSATPFTLAPEDVNGKIVNVETIANQTANKFEWIVKSGDSSSNFTLTDRVADLVAERINFKGLVTFSGLSTDAKNEIGKVAQSKVDGLEVGGRNLLVQKNITEGYLSTDGKGSFIGSGGGDQTSDWIDVSGNKYITVTLYEDFTNTNNSGRYCEYDADKNCINTVVYNPRQKSSIIIELKSNTKYIRVTAIECKTRRYKIEAGNKATDWTPAPEDVSQDATNKASQALTDAENYSSNAVNWVASNGSSTTSLNSMVKKWTDGAVSDTTQMNGGWIKANTITASKIAIGDFTNYCQLNKDTASYYGFTATDDTKGVWFTANPIDRDKDISQWFTCEGGQKLYVEYDLSTTVKGKLKASDTDISYLTSGIMIFVTNGTKEIISYTRSKGVTATSDGAITHISVVETLPADARFFRVILQTDGQGNTFSGTLKIRNPQVRKATTGKLIVDGSITADKIAANAITADKIATDAIKSHNYISSGGTQGSFLNLKDGSFTAPNLSWDLNGNLIAKNANLSGEITATKGKIGKYTITDQWLITGSGSTASGFGGNQAFWAGSSSSNDAPFRVGYNGKLYANGATISGDITATTGKIGDLTLKDGILTGTGSYSEPYTEDDDGTVTSTITTNYITKLFGKGLTIDSTVKYSDEDDVYSYKVSVLPDEISFTDGEEIGMLGAGGLQILQVNDNSDSYSSEANEVSLSSGASNFYYTTPVNQTTDKYLHVCFSADGASFMASQGDKFNSFDIGYSSAKYSGNFAANKFVYTGNSLNYVECLEANDTTNIYFHSNGYYSFRVNNEGNWSNETQSVYITGRGISVPGQIGLYSQEMSNYVARYYIAGSTKSTAIGNNSYQTRIYGSSVWANKAVSTSDVRLKQDFQSLDKFEDLYMQLQPVSFKYIDGYDKSEDRYFGLKAQPTEKLFEDMGENPDDYAMFNKFGIDHEDIKERIGYDVDFDEEHGLDYTNLITLNTHMVQKTRRELAELQKENAELKDMLKTIVKKINM